MPGEIENVHWGVGLLGWVWLPGWAGSACAAAAAVGRKMRIEMSVGKRKEFAQEHCCSVREKREWTHICTYIGVLIILEES